MDWLCPKSSLTAAGGGLVLLGSQGPVSAPCARSRAAVRCWGALLGAGRGGNASPILVCFFLPSSGRIWELESPLKLSQKVPWYNLIAQSRINEAFASFFFPPHRFYLPFGIILPLAVAFPHIQPGIFHVEGITYVSLITHGSLGVPAPRIAQLKGSKKKKNPKDEYPVNFLENNSE